jgi:hypothetical protein
MSVTEHEDGLYPVMMAEQVRVIGTDGRAWADWRSCSAVLLSAWRAARTNPLCAIHDVPSCRPREQMARTPADGAAHECRTHNAAADEDQHARAEALEDGGSRTSFLVDVPSTEIVLG